MIIGLTGYAKSGKDTVANVLAGQGFQPLAIASSLKRLLVDFDPKVPVLGGTTVSLSDMVLNYGWDKTKDIAEVRKMLQVMGDACRKNLGDDALLMPVIQKIEDDPERDWVVSDVRLPEEANALRSLGASIWRIKRPGVGPVNKHRTETALDRIRPDAVIDNDADIPSLTAKVLAQLSMITEVAV